MFRGDSDYQCTHCSTDVLGFDREVGNMYGECRGICGNVGKGRGRYGECVETRGMGSWSTDDDQEC